MANIERKIIEGFGDEWSRFDQSGLDDAELRRAFEGYFRIFPWHALPPAAEGFDMGCGSGRWAKLVAPRVGKLHCIDPSEALEVAKRNLAAQPNCIFHRATVDDFPLADGSQDFGYSLGVLHHIPDTDGALAACVKKLKPGAPFLLYLYYAFDNRPWWFRALWAASDAVRLVVSRLPMAMRYAVSQVLAAMVYWPLARSAKLLDRAGVEARNFPLWFYRDKSFYMLRTDALDRFGTRLEQRFTRAQIEAMMSAGGLERVAFNDGPPYWCAVGYRKT